MIDSTIQFLATEVNSYLLRRTASDLVKVEPGGLANDSGTWAVLENSIGLSLANVEEEWRYGHSCRSEFSKTAPISCWLLS